MLFQPDLFVRGFKGDEPQNRKNLMSLVIRQALPAAVPDEMIRPFAGDEAANSPSRAIKSPYPTIQLGAETHLAT